mmetsp:Transcript_28202/g.59576  ORF Transcript_28202/g.59576 Transcript_28202/m.59576 type:complete len:440 (+) Transcript_28202:73-1392(+)|eukprot:CAMPEP_0183722152 /NCGR_PEP_ID=MMETSP0737-20130205/14195_1 /TAXON_ID=385413 /ORGANISM="Thalassiosira miniscula, Strain CCMP1093" /LENGTH=439 /DNA_ID=CAMNT_0025952265 /DNA_START=14 /DNA_END=1333 /DNA_ORIENTATION=-
MDSSSTAAAAPKRVSGGIVLKAKKKKKRKIQRDHNIISTKTNGQRQNSAAELSSSSVGVPSILSSVPVNETAEDQRSNKQSPSDHDEFGDDDDDFASDLDAMNDALLCLQSYTRSPTGGMSETCAYCPIFTHVDGDGSSSSSTYAAPFLTKRILLHLQNANSQSSNHTSSSISHIEQQIKQMAFSNKVRLLQLNGTATTRSGGGVNGWRGDGNDDEDVAVMETSSYTVAAEMALQNYFQAQSSSSTLHQRGYKVNALHSWLTMVVLPYFSGKIWFSSGALESFYENANSFSNQRNIASMKNGHGSDHATIKRHTLSQMKEMIQQFVHAGLLLPRRGVGPSGGLQGYWFSLPGLGRAAKSIVDGRSNLLRRLQSSRYKEKKRSVLEHEIGRIKHPSTTTTNAKKSKIEQSGKFVVLDLLAKGWVSIHTTCTGEQFVRLTD